MHRAKHWLASAPQYSADPRDVRYLPTEDEAVAHREAGWHVDGPFVLLAAPAAAVDALEKIASRDTLRTATLAGCRRVAREALASLRSAV